MLVATDKLSAPTLEAAIAWRSSVDPSKLFAKEAFSSGMRLETSNLINVCDEID